jgi:transcriptional regulator of acetoin/glycerol metabolism
VQEALLAYGWPGNIRELHSVLRYALAVGDDGLITLADLPLELKAVASDGRSHGAGGPTIGASAAAVEARAARSSQREELMALLKRHRWGITGAARELGVCRATVYRRMKRLGIVPPHLL